MTERHDPPRPSRDDAESGAGEPSATRAGGQPSASEPGAGEPSASGSAGPTTAHDALRRLEQRLDRASEAAERLISEAAQSAASAAGRIPPAGWQIPRTEPPGTGETPGAGERPAAGEPAAGETELLIHVVQSLRDLIPPELQRRLAEAIRELLIAVRALIDWYLERIERNRTEPVEVEDIPIL